MHALRKVIVVTAAAGATLAVATAASTAATAAPAPATAGTTKIVHACDQNVAPGHFACQALRRVAVGVRPAAAAAAAAAPQGYGPADLKSAYKLPTANGSGKRVYIIDAYDDPKAESDLAKYRSTFGLPPCTTANGCFRKLNQNGARSPLPKANSGWSGEISLDLDMVSATCPKCAITLIEANSSGNDLFIAIKKAVSLGAKFVSMSFGGSETGSEASYDSKYFAASGVVYTASTGDNGNLAGVSYPATSPRVVAVGGTSLAKASNARGWSESAWDGAGSGCSSDEAKPSWQSSITACSKRATADVSAVADPNTGVAVYQTYGATGWTVYGGTSASAPIIASVYALHGTPASGSHPAQYPYSHTGQLFDVKSGSNGLFCSPAKLCNAGAGWDGPTGLGTPNGAGAFGA